MINGSVLDQQNRPMYDLAQAIITNFKRAKLYARHEKNAAHPWTAQDILNHLESEVIEFKEALKTTDALQPLLELADISNMVDIMAMHLLDLNFKTDAILA